MCKFTPKMCACDKPTVLDQETQSCECCQHQRMLSGWPAEWCEPCVLTRFPRSLWGMWELYQKSISPIIGMGAAYWDINVEKYRFRTRHVPDEDLDDIMDMLEQIGSFFNDLSAQQGGLGWDEEDINFLRDFDKEEDQDDEEEDEIGGESRE